MYRFGLVSLRKRLTLFRACCARTRVEGGQLESRRRCSVITRLQIGALGAVGILAAVSPLFAHHTWPVNCAASITVTGTVTEYTWANPHVMISLDVKRDDGTVEKWSVGGPSLNRMAANTWGRDTLKAGDVITGTGNRFLDGANVLKLSKVVMANGKEMTLYESC
jgi:hypothetical protein